jgi:thioredoxin-related protein
MTTTCTVSLRLSLLMTVVFMALPAPAAAQGVNWKSDYAAARKEAFEKGRPLLLVFGGDHCMWCRKLEATTLRDSAVVTLLTERFVCLKLDGDREHNLTQTLRVISYPTMIIAAPDGKIIETIEGFVEVPRMVAALGQAAPKLVAPAPEWMLKDFQEAARAIAISDYSRAIGLLQNVVRDGGERSIQVKARQVLGDLESQATAQLTLAKTLHQKNRGQEAVNVLTDLLSSYGGTSAAQESAQLMATLVAKPEVREGLRIRKAREMLALAREDFQSQQFLGCLERCELLMTSYSDLAESSEAKKLMTSIQENPEHLAKACEALNFRTAAMYLALAESWAAKGQPEQAVICLERIMQIAPGSRQAEAAQTRLASLQTQQRTSAYPLMDRK